MKELASRSDQQGLVLMCGIDSRCRRISDKAAKASSSNQTRF